MKRTLKIGLVVLVVGLITLVAGWYGHGFQDVTFNQHRRPELVNTKTVKHNMAAFDDLQVDVKDCQVRLKQGDKYSVSMRTTSKSVPTVKMVGKMLVIKQAHPTNSVTGWSFGDNEGGLFGFGSITKDGLPNRTIVITVPKDKHLQQVKMHTETGALRLTDVNVSDLTVSAGDNISLEKMGQVSHLQATANDGRVEMSDLTAMNPSVTAESVSLSNVTLNQGTFKVTDDTFTMQNDGFSGIVNVMNNGGDNKVWGADKNKGYQLHGEDESTLFDQHSDSDGTLQINPDAPDQLRLTTTAGGNSVQAN
ncbi:DUF4097 family beta strand repeat-containing protein [Furfurilactobacillus siliginis]|uniref:DUF4097 domain-containing protein n=1 Tax=Furfurilactobacillus siliginis TaxID=348151 RepID=A0A0R2L5Z4_9LACO|nr:DUF4097 family beta strand repeat-containing protein [Furfurilactobacillus siliginis]KRN94682.1 hypothetical protein IV55_GL000450 [Furfurilactobacillus siliginis]GEK28394.1 hypothetical protein LSI01_07050 [Furfurilactobacillus siliginis]